MLGRCREEEDGGKEEGLEEERGQCSQAQIQHAREPHWSIIQGTLQ